MEFGSQHIEQAPNISRFSERFSPGEIIRLLDGYVPSTREVKTLLKKESLALSDIARLIRAFENESHRSDIIDETIHRRQETWNGELYLMSPFYVSNGDPEAKGCQDYCVYCPWRHGNVPANKLIRLTPTEIKNGVHHLLKLGYGDVELVMATDPKFRDADSAAHIVRAAKEAGAKNIGINFFPFESPEDYEKLAKAGCTFSIVWQETYIPYLYKTIHPRGPKAIMERRLNAHDCALQGGIKTVGVGFLGGLADWRFEALVAIDHASYLREEYNANIIFGMPRWKAGGDVPLAFAPAPYGDTEYEFVGMLYSLAMPEALPWFSTREDFDLSAHAARGGGCMFTLDCSTAVNYDDKDGASQFPVNSYPFKCGMKQLKQLGFNPQVHLPWKN